MSGRRFWAALQSTPQAKNPDPIDRWTASVLAGLADAALFPFGGPPHHPFQRWARRADPSLSSSPLGILIHPEFGLWHALRGALLFKERLELPASEPRAQSLRYLRRQALPAHLPGRRLHRERLRHRLLPGLSRTLSGPALHDPGLPGAPGLPGRPRARLSRRAGPAPDAGVPARLSGYSAACSSACHRAPALQQGASVGLRALSHARFLHVAEAANLLRACARVRPQSRGCARSRRLAQLVEQRLVLGSAAGAPSGARRCGRTGRRPCRAGALRRASRRMARSIQGP